MPRTDPTTSLATWGIVALALALGVRAVRADDVDTALAQAKASRDAGDAAGALARLRALGDDPATGSDPRVQAALGAALLEAGEPAEAVTAWRAVVRVRPLAADRLALARALLATAKDRIDAGARLSAGVVPWLEDALTEAAAAAPTDPAQRLLAARVTAEADLILGRAAKARDALSAEGVVRDAYAEDLLARACYATGDFAAAADAWGRAGNRDGQASAWSAAKDPRAIEAYAASALTHLDDPAIGDRAIRGAAYVDGGEGLERLLTAANVEAAARPALDRLLGRLAERRGRAKDAVARYRAVVAAREGDVLARRDLARALLTLSADDPSVGDEAITIYLDVLQRKPDDADAREGLSWQARTDATNAHREWPDHRRLDRAVAIFKALAQASPDDGVAWAQWGNAARIAGDDAAATIAFEKAVAASPFDASTWNDRGIALLAAGRRQDALASFAKAAEIDPGDTAPRQNAARLLRLAGRDDDADAHLAAALRTARATGGPASLYRALLDRGLRARARPELR